MALLAHEDWEDELPLPEIPDRKHAQALVTEWRGRLDRLYEQASEALKAIPGLDVRRRRVSGIAEPALAQAGLRTYAAEGLVALRDGETFLAIWPRALVAPPSRGRVNLFVGGQSYDVVDMSEKPGRTDWRVYGPSIEPGGVPFAKALRSRLRSKRHVGAT